MSIWSDRDVLQAVLEAIDGVHLNSSQAHVLGKPYLTAYQIAIKVDASHPLIREELGLPLGGRGAGAHSSFAQYLAKQLSRDIRTLGTASEVEGAFLSNEHVQNLCFTDAEGGNVESSLTGTPADLSLFRRREATPT
jgi:hypothetical protein